MDSRSPVGDHESARANPSYRTDIQSLRGLAVLLVLFYHAGSYRFRAGYLGVDVFFVISGFLMTRVITDGIAAGSFRFSAFYWRRAKRLLPAAYATFLVTALLAPVLLTSSELDSFVGQLAGALTLSGNFVLWMQHGYFQIEAELKPLLHVWSLGLEEQYYLLLPALLVFIPARRWSRSAFILLVVSLVLCLVLVTRAPSATFYLLPMRAWELALGSWAAAAMLDRAPHQPRIAWLFWPAAAVLLLIPMRPIGAPHPSLDALLVCVATMIVLVARHPVLNQGPAPRVLAFVGDFSYSLYLVHWPIFAFLNNVYLGGPPRSVRLQAVALSLVLGYALFRWVEVPIRRSALKPTRRLLAATAAATIAILAVPVAGAALLSDGMDYAGRRRANQGLGDQCDDFFYRSPASTVNLCRRGSNPKILIWGDSYAMQWVFGIAAVTEADLLQATRSTCAPILDYTSVSTADPEWGRAWAEACLAFNQSVFDVLSRTPSIELVVLSGEPGKLLDHEEGSEWRVLRNADGTLTEEEASTAEAVRAMQATANAIRALGKRVVFIPQIPYSGFDPGACQERKATGRLVLGVDSLCRVSAATYRGSGTRGMLQRLQSAGEGVLGIDSVLCGAEFCRTELDGVPLYRDGGHLSHEGSRLLARKLDLATMLFATAK